jgi:tRNA-dihydrouridine synthase
MVDGSEPAFRSAFRNAPVLHEGEELPRLATEPPTLAEPLPLYVASIPMVEAPAYVVSARVRERERVGRRSRVEACWAGNDDIVVGETCAWCAAMAAEDAEAAAAGVGEALDHAWPERASLLAARARPTTPSPYPSPKLVEPAPTIVQIAGTSPAAVAEAALAFAPMGDVLELNLGCPQRCAKRAGYGSFLRERADSETLVNIVRALRCPAAPGKPVAVKIRRLLTPDETVAYARLLLDEGGADFITLHARTRQQRRSGEEPADWDHLRALVAAFGDRVRVVGNGNVAEHADVHLMLRETGVDAVMSASTLLVHPTLFADPRTDRTQESRVHEAFIYLWAALRTGVRRRSVARHLLEILGKANRHRAPRLAKTLLAWRGRLEFIEAGDVDALAEVEEDLRTLLLDLRAMRLARAARATSHRAEQPAIGEQGVETWRQIARDHGFEDVPDAEADAELA